MPAILVVLASLLVSVLLGGGSPDAGRSRVALLNRIGTRPAFPY
jgi:hypothetical protein